MYVKYEIQSENAKCNIRNFYNGNRNEAEGRPVLSTFKSCPNLENIVRILQDNEGSLLIVQNKIRLLAFANNLDIIGDLLADTINAARVIEEAAKKIDLEINLEETKIK